MGGRVAALLFQASQVNFKIGVFQTYSQKNTYSLGSGVQCFPFSLLSFANVIQGFAVRRFRASCIKKVLFMGCLY